MYLYIYTWIHTRIHIHTCTTGQPPLPAAPDRKSRDQMSLLRCNKKQIYIYYIYIHIYVNIYIYKHTYTYMNICMYMYKWPILTPFCIQQEE